MKQKIILVDDNITTLTIGKDALSPYYEVFTVPSGEKLFKILSSVIPDLILLDIEMPEMDGYEVIKVLKGDKRTQDIPIIFLTAKGDQGSELQGFDLGAIDYISKPFSTPLLLKRIEVHLLVASQKKQLELYNTDLQKMVGEKTKTVTELQNAVFRILSEVVEYRDDNTGNHITRTQKFYSILLNALIENKVYTDEVSKWDTELVIMSSQLHDVGKVGIRDSILLKPARLTPEEFDIMQQHAVIGANLIERIEKSTSERKFIKHAKLMAGTHHEKWDGSGYPIGLSETSIPLQGRIMAVVDVYDALISERPYKPPIPHENAMEIIKESSGTHFDPRIVEVFLKVADKIEDVLKDAAKQKAR
ncbi:MAG: response regulator [Deferribacteraceae bacterium]|jgi:putative two-component system response regulator|nr:response regulator [Deferribacteraceae bacterium]